MWWRVTIRALIRWANIFIFCLLWIMGWKVGGVCFVSVSDVQGEPYIVRD